MGPTVDEFCVLGVYDFEKNGRPQGPVFNLFRFVLMLKLRSSYIVDLYFCIVLKRIIFYGSTMTTCLLTNFCTIFTKI